jgi:phage FluMu protein Com
VRTQPKEVRCTACNILLAKVEENGLVIQRGELQATIHGEFHAALVCYRPRCRKLNVLRLSTVTRPAVATA